MFLLSQQAKRVNRDVVKHSVGKKKVPRMFVGVYCLFVYMAMTCFTGSN